MNHYSPATTGLIPILHSPEGRSSFMKVILQTLDPVIVTGSEGLIGKELTRRLRDSGGDVRTFDIASGQDISDERCVNEFMTMNKDAKYLVHLAGVDDKVVDYKERLELDAAKFNEAVITNISGTMLANRAFVETRVCGVVVNASSVYSIKGSPARWYGNKLGKSPAYTASKAAVNRLSSHLASAYGPHFRINSLIIGAVRQQQGKQFVKNYSNETALGRMMELEEVLDPILFLLSDSASYITGADIIVDGGYRI